MIFNSHNCRIEPGKHHHAGNQVLSFNNEGKENALDWLGNKKPYNSISFDYNTANEKYAIVVCDKHKSSGKCIKSTQSCTKLENIKSIYITKDLRHMKGTV